MLLQELNITTFAQAAGAVLKNVVKQTTAAYKQMKLPTAATTTRYSDDDKVQEVDEPVRQLPPEGVTNGGSDPNDAEMYT